MKILVRATNWVGDAVMSIPALEAIRARWPQAEITILARPWVADLYRSQPFQDGIVPMDAAASRGNFFAVERLGHALRKEKFDCAILLQNAFGAAWLAWRAGIPERVGYSRDARRLFLTKAVPVPKRGEVPAHESFYYLEFLRRAGWLRELPEVQEIRLEVAAEATERAAEKLHIAGARRGARRIAMAPGAAFGSAKCWLPERFAALADRLIADADADVILFGSESERSVTDLIAAAMRRPPINLAGATAIGDLPALFKACELFVGNDSGAMHVAAAVGLPVVAIFGPTDPHGTAPVTPRRTIVQQKVECSPCFLRHCPIDHRCMTRIEVDFVYDAARGWLERLPRA